MTWLQYKRFNFFSCAIFCLAISMNLHAMDSSTEENDVQENNIQVNTLPKEPLTIKEMVKKYRYEMLILFKLAVDVFVTYQQFHDIGAVNQFADALESFPSANCSGVCRGNIMELSDKAYNAYVAGIFYILFSSASVAGDLISLTTSRCKNECLKGGPNMCFLGSDLIKFICALGANANLWQGALNYMEDVPLSIRNELQEAMESNIPVLAISSIEALPVLGCLWLSFLCEFFKPHSH